MRAQLGGLAHDGTAQIQMAMRGHQKHGFDAFVQLFVGQNQRHFVFKIGDGAQTARDKSRVHRAREIHRQTGKRRGFDVSPAAFFNRAAQHFDALVGRKKRHFARIDAHAHHNAVEQTRGFTQNVHVPARNRVEGAGINRGFHWRGSIRRIAANRESGERNARPIRRLPAVTTQTHDVAVIGAGIAGLTAAALLARDGADVILLEQHDKPGGCAGYFNVPSKWGDFQFPVGATVALGLEQNGLHRQIFEMLGAQCAATPLDRLSVFLPDARIELWHDAAKWNRERAQLSGNRRGQELFWRLQEQIADAGWFALHRKPALPLQKPIDVARNLTLAHPRILPMLAALPFSVGEWMKWLRVDRDRAFSALVNLQLLITTQSLSHQAPLSNGMAGLDLWRHGGFHPHGGVGTLAQILLDAYRNHGGQTRFSTRVTNVRRDGKVWRIETERSTICARKIIANVPLANLPALVPACDVAALGERAGQSWGAATLYIALREECVPADLPLHSQILSRYAATPPYIRAGAGDDLFLSLSPRGDLASAPRGWRALNVSTHVRLRDWRNLSEIEYRAHKKIWRDRLLDGVRVAVPNFDAGKGFVITGTPSSWENYTLRASGGVGGAPLSRRNANLRALPSRIGLPDFRLVGDSTFPGQGTVACALSGFNAWRDLRE